MVHLYGGEWNGHNSLFTLISTVLIVQIFLQIRVINELSSKMKKCIHLLSDLVLGAYLVSYIFDSIFYPYFKINISNFSYKFEYYFLIVPLVFVCSFFLSYILNRIYIFSNKLILNLLNRQ